MSITLISSKELVEEGPHTFVEITQHGAICSCGLDNYCLSIVHGLSITAGAQGRCASTYLFDRRK